MVGLHIVLVIKQHDDGRGTMDRFIELAARKPKPIEVFSMKGYELVASVKVVERLEPRRTHGLRSPTRMTST